MDQKSEPSLNQDLVSENVQTQNDNPIVMIEEVNENEEDNALNSSNSNKKTRFQVKKIDFSKKNFKKFTTFEQEDYDINEDSDFDKDDFNKNKKLNFINKNNENESKKLSNLDLSTNGGSNESISANTYNTQYLKSLRNYTREPLPRVAHYRNTLTMHTHHNRPSLDELHNPSLLSSDIKISTRKKRSIDALSSSFSAVKLGWIQGVLVRCLLNIWGVMLFLRLPWVVGQAGLINAILIMLLATLVTTVTTISMSAICTNGEVKGGGAYYMISRSLGPEFGGAIGAIFSLANAVAVAMYVVGFCESFLGLLLKNGIILIDGSVQDIRIIGLLVVSILLAISIIGMEWENKTQLILLLILVSAMFNFFIGTFIPPSDKQKSQGFFGYNFDILMENMMPRYRNNHNFFSVFSIIFPAATGILAGANISGDLSRPSEAIPKGTFLAILISTISYILFMIICAFTTLRNANGLMSYKIDTNLLSNKLSNTLVSESKNVNFLIESSINQAYLFKDNIDEVKLTLSKVSDCYLLDNHTCNYGLLNSDQVMIMIAPIGSFIYAGIFAATLSSALASLVSAPKVFQALCKDNLFPYISVFGKGYGKSNEPRRAYILTYLIAVTCILIGQLNLIAPIISNFFLAAYCIINFSCFHASFSKSPGFRPSFHYYNKWLSLIGSILCLCVMFIMNWWTALLTFVLILFLFIYIHYRKPDVNWGSSTQAEAYIRALKAVKKLIDIPDHVKTFRPQMLVLAGKPMKRPALLDFANCITNKIALLIIGDVELNDITTKVRKNFIHRAQKFLEKRKLDAFYQIKTDRSFSEGAKALIELSGLGKLKPNILLIGYKNNWQESSSYELMEYFQTIHYAFDLHMSVCILRVPGGLDISKYEEVMDDFTNNEFAFNKQYVEKDAGIELVVQGLGDKEIESGIPRSASSAQLSNVLRPTVSWFELFAAFKVARGENSAVSTPRLPRNDYENSKEKEEKEYLNSNIGEKKQINSLNLGDNLEKLKIEDNQTENKSFYINIDNVKSKFSNPRELSIRRNMFQKKQKKGTIDVWWLYDDGGLTMLIPHIMANRTQFRNCTLRVFTLANRKDELDREKRNMAALLSKFRIDFSDVTVIPDIVKPPKDETIEEFQNLINKYIVDENYQLSTNQNCVIRESELLALKDKNNRHIRLREMLMEHSNDASLVVMTLSVPRKGTCSAPLFMAWLEILTSGMPPFLLVRGNQTSVLTFYS